METATPGNELQNRRCTIKLWPPSQDTRLTLVNRMAENLSNPSSFFRKYGLLSKEEAEDNAKHIEDMAFVAANEHFEKEPDGDGSDAVQLYARESSKLMLEVLKRGPKANEDGAPASCSTPVSQSNIFDISGGRRAFIEAEEAEELLKPLREPGNLYTSIRFSNRSFGISAARVAEPILMSVRGQLTDVDLSDFIAGRPEAEALEVMTIFSMALVGCTLKSLNLSDNALGEKGVRAFGALLKAQNSLEELYLINNGISKEAAQALCELVSSTEKLRVLHFHNNMTGDEGAVAIAEVVKKSPTLEDFRCSSTRLGSDGGVALAEGLKTCTKLKNLDLRDNMFGIDAGIALCKALSKCAYLTEVYLSYLNLEDSGAVAVANALKESASPLKVLELAGNDISAEAAAALANCISEKQSLVKLNLSENELKDDGCILISKALRDGHVDLKEVDLSSNMIRRVGARLLAEAVMEKPAFVMLNINGNYISEEGIDEVKDILRARKSSGVLGPLDENDPEGRDEDVRSDADEAHAKVEDELGSKIQQLKFEE